MNRARFELVKRIVMESASILQRYEENHRLPEDKQVLTCSQEWADLSDELDRAAGIVGMYADELAKGGW